MQAKTSKKVYHVTVEFENSSSRTVKVKAIDPEKAEERALKFHPTAVKVKCNA